MSFCKGCACGGIFLRWGVEVGAFAFVWAAARRHARTLLRACHGLGGRGGQIDGVGGVFVWTRYQDSTA